MVFVQLFRDMPSIESVPAIEPDYTKWPIFLATTIYAFEVNLCELIILKTLGHISL